MSDRTSANKKKVKLIEFFHHLFLETKQRKQMILNDPIPFLFISV